MKRIAIFGGSFDPFHLGHLEIIRTVDHHLKPDQILVVPCGNPPHRTNNYADAQHRLNMINLGCEALVPSLKAQLQIDNRELVSNAISYSYHTVSAIAKENPDCQLLTVLGWDSLQAFTSWHRWKDILALSALAVVTRNDKTEIQSEDLPISIQQIKEAQTLDLIEKGAIYELPFTAVKVSSTEIRAAIAQGGSCDGSVSESVTGYIKQNELYRG